MSNILRPEFPRPDFKRKDWISLNGKWEFAFQEQLTGKFPEDYYDKPLPDYITVPFCYQSKMSRIEITGYHQHVYYSRTFSLDAVPSGEALLKFGAVDYSCDVWINGIHIGNHCGGHTQFEFGVSSYLREGENRILLCVSDDNSCDRPRGKQYWMEKPDRCWYTNTTGIWKSVWIEFTGNTYIKHFKLTPDIDRRVLNIEVYLNQDFTGDFVFECSYKSEFKKHFYASVSNSHFIREKIALQEEDYIDEIHYWTPDSPSLYDCTLKLKNETAADEVCSYFGMRKIETKNGYIFLNNRKLYQRLILDQGYWPESLMTPPSEDATIYDIEMTKKMGFNGARKHQKLEDPLYYYYADKLGLLLWTELPSPYAFNDLEIVSVLSEWQECLTELYNHPSIITWVPMNESWGIRNVITDKQQQAFVSCLYSLTKSYDPMRLISGNDGWEITDATDIFAIHDYAGSGTEIKKRYQDFNEFLKTGVPGRQALANGYEYLGQPVILSEYGGIAFEDKESDETWGYNKHAETKEEFMERLSSITNAVYSLPLFQGFCYTQLTDVMQEINGLMTADRKPKIEPEVLAEIFTKD